MAHNDEGFFSCSNVCWIIGIVFGLLVAYGLNSAAEMGWFWALVVGVLAMFGVYWLLSGMFCSQESATSSDVAAAAQSSVATAGAEVAPLVSTNADTASNTPAAALSDAGGNATITSKPVAPKAAPAKKAAAKKPTAKKATTSKAKSSAAKAKPAEPKAKAAAKSSGATAKKSAAAKSTAKPAAANKTAKAKSSAAKKPVSGSEKPATAKASAAKKGSAKSASAKTAATKAASKTDAKPAAKTPRGMTAAKDGKPALYKKAPAKADDLKLIKGVGPGLEKTLNGLGIYTYAQVSEWKAKEIAWVDDNLKFKGRIKRDGWVKQAKTLAKGGSTEFSKRAKKGSA